MGWMLTLLVGFGLAAGGVKSDKERIQGTWVVVAMEYQGKVQPAEEFRFNRVVFDGERVGLFGGKEKRTEEGSFQINPTQKPKHMDCWISKASWEDKLYGSVTVFGPRPGYLGIYTVEGDTLRICVQPTHSGALGTTRPITFATEPDGGSRLFTLKRLKP